MCISFCMYSFFNWVCIWDMLGHMLTLCLIFWCIKSYIYIPKQHYVCSVAQLCLTVCSPMVCNLQGLSVHGIFQARVLVQVAISFSKGFSQPRDWTCVSCISCTGRWILYHCALYVNYISIQLEKRTFWECQSVFQGSHTILHSYQLCMSVSIFSFPANTSFLFNIAILPLMK